MFSKNPFEHKVHVVFKREDLELEVLHDKVVIVLDILFATTTIVGAISEGASCVIPVRNEKEARAEAEGRSSGSYTLAGELYAETIPGFNSPLPLALAESGLRGKALIYSTTNGTVALAQTSTAAKVYVGALTNARAVVQRLCSDHPEKPILIVCSGSMGLPNLEDIFGAGYFVELLRKLRGDHIRNYSDAALTAEHVFNQSRVLEILLSTRVGRMLSRRGKEREVEYASQLSVVDIAPELKNNQVII